MSVYTNFIAQFDTREVLGKGAFGTVKAATRRGSEKLVAIKLLRWSPMDKLVQGR